MATVVAIYKNGFDSIRTLVDVGGGIGGGGEGVPAYQGH